MGGSHCGLTVLPPSELPKDALVYVSNMKQYDAIEAQLLAMGLAKEQIRNVGRAYHALGERQYFDLPAFVPQENEAFVDAGVFDGNTSRCFMRWAKKGFSQIYCFEPDARNAARIRENMKDVMAAGKLSLFERGVWDREETLSFPNAGTGSGSLGTGDSEVLTTSLDAAIGDQKVTFLKMDVEGAEYRALCGAKDIITRQRPRLAICAYHKPEDILDLPALILSLVPDYRLYLRHYSIFSNETVIYAI